MKTKAWRHWRHSGVFIVNFKHISQLFLVFNFEQVNANWVMNQIDGITCLTLLRLVPKVKHRFKKPATKSQIC